MKKLFNFDYFGFWQELLMAIFITISAKKREFKHKNGRILIVSPCLIGEFAVTIPAIYDFIQRNKDKNIDLLVTPPLKILAEKIRGIGKIYAAASNYGREYDSFAGDEITDSYEKIIVLRISAKAYAMVRKVKSGEIVTASSYAIKYLGHLAKNLILRRTPKSWRKMNFEILGGNDGPVSFKEIFAFNQYDFKKLNKFDCLKTGGKMIIIHTAANWPMKIWEDDNWVELLKKINRMGNFKFVFIGDNAALKSYEYISSCLDFEMESLINKTNILELVLVLSKADYFIGIDSGPSNLAHLVDLRSITIFGPGPNIYMPHNQADIIIDKSNGRGLFQLFFNVKNSLINKINVSEVYNAFKSLNR